MPLTTPRLTVERIAVSFALACCLGASPASASPEQVVALNEDAALTKQLHAAFEALGDNYEPRTEHFLPDGEPTYINRLILEDSPYLRQHAHNPVNWYPWGEEAFAAAKAQDKPVFLSIGYATCHWCHVMERESFEDEAIAQQMNEHFINIKVDREQLPDVDALFMTSVLMIAGRGGWPMSNFTDTDGRPFFGGTYYPPEQFSTLLGRVVDLWEADRPALLQQSEQIATAVAEVSASSGEAKAVGSREIDRAVQTALANFDSQLGGFSQAPKFPMEATLFMLLDAASRKGDNDALDAADFTLKRMAGGGIHDQVGGGFHRYSVDSRWLVPHFEKMLYNQAALSRIYAQAYQLTGHAGHARTARNALDYVLREMTSPEGLFYSATDADSAGAEGLFFTWTEEEIDEALGEQDAVVARALWNVTPMGNFDDRNILHRPRPLRQIARELNVSVAELEARRDRLAVALREHREAREHPLLDNKALTAWNGMMVTALAEVGVRLGEPRYVEAAVRAGEAVWTHLRRGTGDLWRSRFDGRSSIAATQADYAYLGEAYLALHDATGDAHWLDRTREVAAAMVERFWDPKDGGFYMGTQVVAGAALPTRPKDMYDNAIPSGNSVALRVLAGLFARTGEPGYEQQADQLVSALGGRMAQNPSSMAYAVKALAEHLEGESGAVRYAARGKVRARAERAGDRVRVHIDMQPGWHINANEPLQDYLIATTLGDSAGQSLTGTRYPAPVMRKLGFERNTLALYEGTALLDAPLPAARDGQTVTELSLRLQACDDEVCLPPETLSLIVPTL